MKPKPKPTALTRVPGGTLGTIQGNERNLILAYANVRARGQDYALVTMAQDMRMAERPLAIKVNKLARKTPGLLRIFDSGPGRKLLAVRLATGPQDTALIANNAARAGHRSDLQGDQAEAIVQVHRPIVGRRRLERAVVTAIAVQPPRPLKSRIAQYAGGGEGVFASIRRRMEEADREWRRRQEERSA